MEALIHCWWGFLAALQNSLAVLKGKHQSIIPLVSVAHLVGALSRRPKGLRFDAWSGQMPGLWVWSQSEQEATDQCFSFS